MELSLDTAGDVAGIGLSEQGVALTEVRWRCPRMQGAQLLPAVDEMLRRSGVTKHDLNAIFVCLGPGSYMGVRVGVATAHGLSQALALPVVGIGRLALDAWGHRGYDGPILPVHKAGRSEWAWAAYAWRDEGWEELIAPRLGTAQSLAEDAPSHALVCGEPNDDLLSLLRPARWVRGESVTRRPAALCELGWARLSRSGPDGIEALQPLYLREPAIGPQA